MSTFAARSEQVHKWLETVFVPGCVEQAEARHPVEQRGSEEIPKKPADSEDKEDDKAARRARARARSTLEAHDSESEGEGERRETLGLGRASSSDRGQQQPASSSSRAPSSRTQPSSSRSSSASSGGGLEAHHRLKRHAVSSAGPGLHAHKHGRHSASSGTGAAAGSSSYDEGSGPRHEPTGTDADVNEWGLADWMKRMQGLAGEEQLRLARAKLLETEQAATGEHGLNS